MRTSHIVLRTLSWGIVLLTILTLLLGLIQNSNRIMEVLLSIVSLLCICWVGLMTYVISYK